jgi:hypothetical protein
MNAALQISFSSAPAGRFSPRSNSFRTTVISGRRSSSRSARFRIRSASISTSSGSAFAGTVAK